MGGHVGPAPMWLSCANCDGRWSCSSTHPDIQKHLQTCSIQHNLPEAWLTEQYLDDGSAEHLLKIWFAWVHKMPGCAVPVHNPKCAWLLYLCAFCTSFFSEGQLQPPLFTSLRFLLTAKEEMPSSHSHALVSQRKSSSPHVALGPMSRLPSLTDRTW